MFTRPGWSSSSGQPTSSTNAITHYSAGDHCPVPGDWWPFKPSPEQQITWEPGHIPAPARWQSTVLLIVTLTPGSSWWVGVGVCGFCTIQVQRKRIKRFTWKACLSHIIQCRSNKVNLFTYIYVYCRVTIYLQDRGDRGPTI